MGQRSVVTDGWTPAFPGQRPPFEPGNQAAVKRGEHVSDLRLSEDPAVAELARLIRDTQVVYHPADEGTIWRLALVYRRLQINAAAQADVDARLADNPVAHYGDSQLAERIRYDLDRWEARAARIEAQLGREPQARAKLGLALKQLAPLDIGRLDAREEDDLRRLLAKAAGLPAGGGGDA